MSFRGPALQYKIRKTTVNNKSGDNYSITIPRIIAQKFEECLFKIAISGNTISFTSGCKLTVDDIQVNNKMFFAGGGTIIFK